MAAKQCILKLPELKLWRAELLKGLPTEAVVTREQAFRHLREMEIMRHFEKMAGGLYLQQKIAGFCHLYYGQESIPEGMHESLSMEDAYIGAYRIHCFAYKRGFTVRQIMGEMFGKGKEAATGGRGGSMHYYSRKNNFYGGNGIVGAQVPVGAGLAFAQKYRKEKNITVASYGDGAANQGQIYEALNMAGLWKLPVIFLCENNKYGMGTSVERASFNTEFYTRGENIPGLYVHAANVFLVRELFKWAKGFVLENGPLFMELETYRYYGHSMSDPGTSYRTKVEVNEVRKKTDPIYMLRHIIEDNQLGTLEEIEQVEEEAKALVDKEIELAENDEPPNPSTIYDHTYADNENHFLRGVAYDESKPGLA